MTLGQLQRATIPRQGSSLSGQHNTTNSTEPDQPVNPCFDEWPAADAARGSEASRTRDLLTHVGDGGRSSMQTGTDTSRESKPSIPQASNLQHPAQARRSPPSESKHSAYEALQRCEESLQGTQTQAKKHAEPAQTQTTPESTFVAWSQEGLPDGMMRFSQLQSYSSRDVCRSDPITSKRQYNHSDSWDFWQRWQFAQVHRGHKPMVRHFSYPRRPHSEPAHGCLWSEHVCHCCRHAMSQSVNFAGTAGMPSQRGIARSGHGVRFRGCRGSSWQCSTCGGAAWRRRGTRPRRRRRPQRQ